MLTKEQQIKFIKSKCSEFIYDNAGLENINATWPDTKTLVENGIVNNMDLDEANILNDLKNAWKFLFINVDSELNLEIIKQINKLVSAHQNLMPGEIRTGNVSIGGTDYVPSIPNEAEIVMNIDAIKTIPDPLERAIEYYLYGSKSQLFFDGNKRTSLLVASKILLSEGIGILNIKRSDIAKFNKLSIDYYNDDINKIDLKDFLITNCITSFEIDGYKLDNPLFSKDDIISIVKTKSTTNARSL